jgi:hypothetical protein
MDRLLGSVPQPVMEEPVTSLIGRGLVAGLLMVSAVGCAVRAGAPAGRDPSLGSSHDLERLAAEEIRTQRASQELSELATTRESWQFDQASGQLITTSNYRLYTTVESPEFLDQLPRFYEMALTHYTTALTLLPQPQVPLETFLFKTRAQWMVKTQQMLPEQTKMFSNLGRGGYTTKGTSVLYYIDRWGYPRETFAIAAHEGWHQYTQETFKHQLPVWLEEGVATYMEGYHRRGQAELQFDPSANYERREALRDAVRDEQLISLHDLLTRTPQSFLSESKDLMLTYYAQVWALTRFLAEGQDGRYKAALDELLHDAAEGRLIGRMMSSSVSAGVRRRAGATNRVGLAVTQEYFNRDLVDFENQYLVFINNLVRTEGRRRGG